VYLAELHPTLGSLWVTPPVSAAAAFSPSRRAAKARRTASGKLQGEPASLASPQGGRAAAGGCHGGRVGRRRGRALAVEYHKPESCKRAHAPANRHPSQS